MPGGLWDSFRQRLLGEEVVVIDGDRAKFVSVNYLGEISPP